MEGFISWSDKKGQRDRQTDGWMLPWDKESRSQPCEGVCSSLAGSGVKCSWHKTQESAAPQDLHYGKPGPCLTEGLLKGQWRSAPAKGVAESSLGLCSTLL